MPEETIRYRVEIDQSDLATQLSQVRQQMDQALGSLSFGRANQSPNFDPYQNAAMDVANAGFQEASNLQNTAINVQNAITEGVEIAQLGYQKFTQDLQMTGLLSPTTPEGQQFANRFVGLTGMNLPQFQEYGAIKSFLGTTAGFGYDSDLPLSRGAYKRGMSRRLSEELPNFLTNALSVPALFIPGVGPIASLGLAFGDEAAKALSPEREATKDMADYIRLTTQRSVMGGMNRQDARRSAERIRELQYDPNLRAIGVGSEEMENVLDQFTKQGGFADVQNVAQYVDRARDTIENFRKVQHALQTTTEEAVRVMAQTTRYGIGGDDPTGFISRIATMSDQTGFSPGELMHVAQQGAEMVRGSGTDLATGAEGAIEMTRFVRQGLKSGLFDPETIRHLGGTTQAALTSQQQALNWGQTPRGRIATYSMLGGGIGVGTPGELGAQAVRSFGDGGVMSVIRNKIAAREAQNELGASGLGIMQAVNYAEEFRSLIGPGEQFNFDELAQYISMSKQIPIRQAELIAGHAFAPEGQAAMNFSQEVLATQQRFSDEQPGILGTVGGGIAAGWEWGIDAIQWPAAQSSRLFDQFGRNIAEFTGQRMTKEERWQRRRTMRGGYNYGKYLEVSRMSRRQRSREQQEFYEKYEKRERGGLPKGVVTVPELIEYATDPESEQYIMDEERQEEIVSRELQDIEEELFPTADYRDVFWGTGELEGNIVNRWLQGSQQTNRYAFTEKGFSEYLGYEGVTQAIDAAYRTPKQFRSRMGQLDREDKAQEFIYKQAKETLKRVQENRNLQGIQEEREFQAGKEGLQKGIQLLTEYSTDFNVKNEIKELAGLKEHIQEDYPDSRAAELFRKLDQTEEGTTEQFIALRDLYTELRKEWDLSDKRLKETKRSAFDWSMLDAGVVAQLSGIKEGAMEEGAWEDLKGSFKTTGFRETIARETEDTLVRGGEKEPVQTGKEVTKGLTTAIEENTIMLDSLKTWLKAHE